MQPCNLLRVVVIGTGALGSTLLERMAGHGVSSVLLIDPDRVQQRNLPLSPFLARAVASAEKSAAANFMRDGLWNKAELLADEAERSYGLQWQAVPCEIADTGWQDLMEVDLFCCCTDNALSRAETAWIARMLNKPVLDGAVFGESVSAGRVTQFAIQPEAACYLCGMGEDTRANVLGYAASASLGCRAPADTPAMTGTIATLQHIAETMMNRMFQFANDQQWPERSSTLKASLRNVAGQSCWKHEQVLLTRSSTCPWHEPAPERLKPLPWKTALEHSLEQNWEVQLAWPICTEATCAA
ncbi:MAG: ThiF family adenylyltransferase, partial [Janthinobacterium lividum]